MFDFTQSGKAGQPLPVHTQRGMQLWSGLDATVLLTTNFRSKKDPKYTALLTDLRGGNVSSEHIAALSTRYIGPGVMPPAGCITVCLTNEAVATHIRYCSVLDAMAFDRCVLLLKAEIWTQASNGKRVAVDVTNQLLLGAEGEKGKRPISLQPIYLGQQTQLQLPNNKLAKLGLANNCVGTLVGVYPYVNLDQSYKIIDNDTLPDALFYHVAANGATFKFPGLPKNVVMIKPTVTQRQTVSGIPAPVSVKHYAVKSMEGVTVHKMQGFTVDNVAVENLSAARYCTNGSYVALSRIKSLSGLYLYPNVKLTDKLLYQNDHAARVEIERLKALDISN